MEIIEVNERTTALIDQLLKIWENSVKATHLFLSCQEIDDIKKYVPELLNAVPHLIVAKNEDESIAFMGIRGQKLEMLFVANGERGKGVGKRLLNYGIEKYGVNELFVNEQNPSARGFYEHMGFRVFKRSDLDEQGNLYPVLYMKSN